MVILAVCLVLAFKFTIVATKSNFLISLLLRHDGAHALPTFSDAMSETDR